MFRRRGDQWDPDPGPIRVGGPRAARRLLLRGLRNDECCWRWVRWLRTQASYHLGLGQWFTMHEACMRCHTPCYEIDYEVQRVGRKRALCMDPVTCSCAVLEEHEGWVVERWR